MKKNTKFIVALTLVLVCLLSLQIAVSADGNTTDTESLSICYVENQVTYRADACFGAPASDRLNTLEANIYREMAFCIKETAAGNRASTDFPVTSDISSLSWTASELGCTLVSGGQITAEAQEAISERFAATLDSQRLMDALVADHPFDLYWFDKTVGMGITYSISGTSERLSIVNVHLRFTVSTDYSVGGAAKTYQIDTAKAAKAATAAENAKAIVAEHAGKTDLAKLEAYRDEICSLVSYNSAAVNNSLPYGNPWQVIYIFDGDSSTNVVCEGYAKAFKYLCDLSTFTSDVYCYTASGIQSYDSTSGSHMWNVVELGGQNYLVDLTDVDSASESERDYFFLAGAASSNGGQTHTVSWKTGFPFFQTQKSYTYTYHADESGLFCNGYLILSSTSYAENSSQAYTVTVTDGEGSGSYTTGTTVTLTAAPAPDGQVFDRWVIESGNVTLADETAATTTFTMPAGDVTVKATYVPQHVHDHSTVWVSDDSNHWHECSCGDKADLTTHDFVWVTDKAPTEDEAGIRHEACTACGTTRNENTSIPTLAHTHSMQLIPAMASTCTEAGNNAYYLCTKCGCYYVDESGATATTPNEQALPLATHVYDSAWKYNSNTHWKECDCGDRGEATAHVHELNASTSPTCTESGKNTYACVCGHSYSENIPAVGHAYTSEVTKQPTVDAVGTRTFVCSNCGDSYTEDIPKLDPPATKPEETTTEPEVTTTEHEITITEPEVTTTEPEVTTTESEETTTEPEVTTTEPEVTTTEHEITTTEPEVTTTEPEVTTTEPEVTTTEPELTTTEPEVTINEPKVATEPNESSSEPESVALETIDLSELLDVGCSSAVSTPTILVLLLSLGACYMLCRRRDQA